MKKARRVFISATAKDRPLVRVLAEKLRAAGFYPWTEDEIRSPHKVLDAVITQLRTSRAVIFLLTPQAVQSPNMLFEAGAAWSSGKPIIPVLAGISPHEIPEPLQEFQSVPFDQFDAAVNQLERELVMPA